MKSIEEKNRATAFEFRGTYKTEHAFESRILTVDDVQHILGISRPSVYKLVNSKQFRVLRVGKKFLIPAKAFELERQNEWKAYACGAWSNPGRLVFTNELGGNLSAQTVYLHFKKLAAQIDCPDLRFHDLRHSYAVTALRSGDDIKTIQENLGHHTAAFTLDVYAHVTAQMKTESANRMQNYISSVI